ncbi:hypothetical protein B0H12DRAFT_450845 [Mycena haematopus]|nr:hypothetical protein B0H12DRAFT_450845 [Mycena haematopus]
MNVNAILRPRGEMSQCAESTLFGIHSTKYLLRVVALDLLHLLLDVLHGIWPRKMAATYIGTRLRLGDERKVKSGSHSEEMLVESAGVITSNIQCAVSSCKETARYCTLPLAVSGATPGMKKCRRGNGTGRESAQRSAK